MTEWLVASGGQDWWVLTRNSWSPARRIEILFEGWIDGRRWTELVRPFQRVVRGGEQIHVHILRSETATTVTVRWRTSRLGGATHEWIEGIDGAAPDRTAPRGPRSVLDDVEMFLANRSRLAFLTIDRDTMLPLTYLYDADGRCFRSIGYVRVGAAMAMEVSHAGPDTPAVRDVFLTKALVAVAVPARRAADIVRRAEHGP